MPATVTAASICRVTSRPTYELIPFSDANRCEVWHSTMREEIQTLNANKTWTLVPFHPSMNVVGLWVYKIKLKVDGIIERYKTHLVTRGFTRQEGIDYFETFNPLIKQATVRLIFSIVVSHDWKIHQFDIHNAFLNGVFDEEAIWNNLQILLTLPFPFMCRLHKSLYDLK